MINETKRAENETNGKLQLNGVDVRSENSDEAKCAWIDCTQLLYIYIDIVFVCSSVHCVLCSHNLTGALELEETTVAADMLCVYNV